MSNTNADNDYDNDSMNHDYSNSNSTLIPECRRLSRFYVLVIKTQRNV